MFTEEIARFTVGLSYNHMPEDVVQSGKAAILDCIGVSLAGSQEAPSRLLCEYVRRQGQPEAGVLGNGFKVAADQAAWANGTIAHALDYDDYFVPLQCTPYHPTVAILPAVLAVAEKYHLSGRQVLLAYVVGFEVAARIALVCAQAQYEVGWHTTSTLGSLGAVAAAANLMGLDEDNVKTALGIAASLSGGLRKNFGTMTKPLHAGNAARNGVVAAMLARSGFTAEMAILDSPLGFADVLGGATYEAERIDQSSAFQIVSPGIAFKPYPSCAYTHWAIDAALGVREDIAENIGRIAAIECRTSSGLPRILIHSRPRTPLEGKFSMEYCIATALIEGKVGLGQFTDASLENPNAQELLRKVTYVHPEYMGSGLTDLKGEIVVKLSNGESYLRRVDVARGDPRNPLGWKSLENKFKDCAGAVLPLKDTEKALGLISHLEDVPDISELMDVLIHNPRDNGRS